MAIKKIALDGPAGVGKSTIAQAIADLLDLILVNSGSFYRALAKAALDAGLWPPDPECIPYCLTVDLAVDRGVVCAINDIPVSMNELKAPEPSNHASTIGVHGAVRTYVNQTIRQYANSLSAVGLICEGRDAGTAIFPDAELKLYFTARPEIRAARMSTDAYTWAAEQIIGRDQRDMSRAESPLLSAEDAKQAGYIIIDTSGLDQGEVLQRSSALVQHILVI